MGEYSLYVRQELEDHEIHVGESCKLVCEFSKPVKVSWYFDRKKITTSQEVKKEHYLTITKATIDNDGRYCCKTKHDNLQYSTSCCLTVKDETTMDMTQLQKEVRRLKEILNNKTQIVVEKEKEKNAFGAKLLQLRGEHEKTKMDLKEAKEQIALLNTEIQTLNLSIGNLKESIKNHVTELEKREQQIQDQTTEMKEFLKYQKERDKKFDQFMKEFKESKEVNGTCSSCATKTEQINSDQIAANETKDKLEEANDLVRVLTRKTLDVEEQLKTAKAEKNNAIQGKEKAEEEKAAVVEAHTTAVNDAKRLEAEAGLRDSPIGGTAGCLPFLCSK